MRSVSAVAPPCGLARVLINNARTYSTFDFTCGSRRFNGERERGSGNEGGTSSLVDFTRGSRRFSGERERGSGNEGGPERLSE